MKDINYMKKALALLLSVMTLISSFGQRTFHLYSPDSSLHVAINTTGQLTYELYAGSTLLVHSSTIDLKLSNSSQLNNSLRKVKSNYSKINETINVPIPYRRKTVINHYNQLELLFKNPFSIQFLLYNNGLAYRIGLQIKASLQVQNETAEFNIDKDANLWFAHINKRDGQDRYHTSYEGVYKKEMLSSIPDTMMTFAPAVASLSNGYHLAFSDANLIDYPGMFLQKTATGLKGSFAPYPIAEEKTAGEFPQYLVSKRADYIAKINGSRMLPWRAVLVGKNDTELPSNDLLYCLGDASKITDPSWIRYGKGTDEWITGINLFNVPFVAGINTESYKYYIDFAKRFGFNQIMLDAGWSDYQDLFKITPGLDLKELVAYAKQKNIRLMLWTLCSTLDKQLDSILPQFNKWGIESIMTDFMDRDDQPMVNFYHRIAKVCADHKITIMFHGAFPPKGINRTWPNIITHEGVLGSEWNIWSDLPTPEHDVAIAYTRMLAGPLDYEPGILWNAQKDQFRTVSKNPMSQGTRCHQLAMFVTYDSPLQIFSGNISQGLLEPTFMELLGSIPTTWDDTKILQGKIGEFIITARRKENDWFISGLNNETKRTIILPLDFLKSDSNYWLTICKDGMNAANYGSDYVLKTEEISFKEPLTITMEKGGGFLIRLTGKEPVKLTNQK
ncbi:MAG: glycoside hydrolase family 97 protein [Sphingobacteriales bacterium]|nr:glycoside hydrolase family 97 protein [Sphingobacteriales bacterium]MBI3720862.1 glycoside hydrolase family 97 protein [Sphingobacteriales bacterium]